MMAEWLALAPQEYHYPFTSVGPGLFLKHHGAGTGTGSRGSQRTMKGIGIVRKHPMVVVVAAATGTATN